MIKNTLLFFGLAALVLIAILSALAGYSAYANNAADRAANSFCGKIAGKSDVALAVSQAQREHVRYRTMNDGKRVEFLFQGHFRRYARVRRLII